MKEQIKTPEKELSNEQIDNLSDAEFKTLVISMLTEIVEYGCEIEEEAKDIGKETGTQINHLDQKEEINIHPEQNEKARIQKNERGLGAPGITLNIPTSVSYRCQKEKNKSKKLKSYWNKY